MMLRSSPLWTDCNDIFGRTRPCLNLTKSHPTSNTLLMFYLIAHQAAHCRRTRNPRYDRFLPRRVSNLARLPKKATRSLSLCFYPTSKEFLIFGYIFQKISDPFRVGKQPGKAYWRCRRDFRRASPYWIRYRIWGSRMINSSSSSKYALRVYLTGNGVTKSCLQKIEIMETKMFSSALHKDPRLPCLYALYTQKIERQNRIRDLKRRIQSTHDVLQLAELKARKRVLRRLGFTTSSDIVDMKGRVACEISSGDELLLTELIFNGAFNPLSPEQCAGLLSCFVFTEKVCLSFAILACLHRNLLERTNHKTERGACGTTPSHARDC